MKTKPANPIPTAFPTCGEVFHFVVAALDVAAWADAFLDAKKKRRDSSEIAAQSDQLRDWGIETDGRVPSRDELTKFLDQQVADLPKAKEVAHVLSNIWAWVLDDHISFVRENATFLDRDGTRAWYARAQAPKAIYFLWIVQKLFRRLAQPPGPILDVPLNELIAQAFPEPAEAAGTMPAYPLRWGCYAHYAKLWPEGLSSVDPKTIAAWKVGEDRPSFDALGRHFSKCPDGLGLLLNFAFAGLLETLASTFQAFITIGDWPECRRLLIGQARCIHNLDDAVAAGLAGLPDMSLADYQRLLSACLNRYMGFLVEIARNHTDSLDLRVARYRVYEEYQQKITVQTPPAKFCDFIGAFGYLWKETALRSPMPNPGEIKNRLNGLRVTFPDFSMIFAGLLFAIDARLMLRQEPHTSDSLQETFKLYQEALERSRYQAGNYPATIIKEALGIAAMLHRRGIGAGTIRPWMKNVLSLWDLFRFGTDFDHEKLDRRIELAELRFSDSLNVELREHLRAAFPQLEWHNWNIGGQFGVVDKVWVETLQDTPVDRRQKKPMSSTIIGRDQTPLMETIDRGQLDRALELVRQGADLNFINSTGDTCVTKAFARGDYGLVLEILCRDTDPIRRETLVRVTTKLRISALENTISEGQVEILRELGRPKPGRGEINLNAERIWNQTPLYYAVSCVAFQRMSPDDAVQYSQRMKTLPISVSPEHLKIFKTAHEQMAKEFNVAGVIVCIRCLIQELHVDLDGPNANDNTALTLAAEARLLDVASILLAAGASVNHRFRGGDTALVRAIINDDYEMAKLLLEFGADYHLFVDALGRPIYTMAMSEKMRQIIPHRP